MPSLLHAIEAKYGQDGRDCDVPIGIYVPRHGPRKCIPRLLILNDCDVDSAGDEESLQKTCSGVIEIDLAHNQLSQWSEISKILQYAPAVSFLNLSFNSLASSLTSTCIENSFRFPLLPRLSVLILIGTNISWDAVWFLLRHANTLQELHLSLNNYSSVDDVRNRWIVGSRNNVSMESSSVAGNENDEDVMMLSQSLTGQTLLFVPPPTSCNRSDSTDSGHGSSSDEDDMGCFPYLRRLMFDGNPVTCWDEVAKLGACFPSLRHMGLADCPISSIPESANRNFENLQSLTISNTAIQDMTDVARLKKFTTLTDLRLQGIPLFNDMTAHERRQLLVALLPNVKKLNGGAPISVNEREDAERAYIRKYVEQDEKPERYYELVAIHGELQPLLDVKFKPTTRIKVRICLADNIFERYLNVYQTTNELKVNLEQVVGLASSKMRLFYVDAEMKEVVGREEMRFPQKQLYSYNMQDGDEIQVEPRKPASGQIPTPASVKIPRAPASV